MFGLRPERYLQLCARMARLSVEECDLEEQFVRAAGPGGQKVNKTSSAVHLRHGPSGIEVKVQTSRSQAHNRFLARERLLDRLDALVEGKKAARQQEVERIRRQKRKRSKRAKEKLLREKHQQTERKQRRKPVDLDS
jgi:protein subunit release factor B